MTNITAMQAQLETRLAYSYPPVATIQIPFVELEESVVASVQTYVNSLSFDNSNLKSITVLSAASDELSSLIRLSRSTATGVIVVMSENRLSLPEENRTVLNVLS